MMLKNTESSYGTIAKVFHWLLFLMLTFSIIAGNFLASMPKGPEKLEAAGMHKSFGVVLLIFILLRLAWRLINPTPKEPEGTTKIQSRMARGMHWVLYILMLTQPISGTLMSQAANIPVSFFGLFELPLLIEKDPSFAQFFRGVHGTVWILLVVAVVGHVGAALHHHFIKKDDVLKSMGFGAKA